MKKLWLIIIFFIGAVGVVKAQDLCPPDRVCLDHATANKALAAITALVEAKDAIAKLTAERTVSDAVIVAANKVLADYKALDEINGQITLKYKDVIGLYEKTIAMYQVLVDKLTTQINKKQSGFQKILAILQRIGDIAAGIALGSVL